MRRAIVLGLAAVLTACATTPAVPPERVDALKAQARSCEAHLPRGYRYEVDRFAIVRVMGMTPGPAISTPAFYDCVFGAGQWKAPSDPPRPTASRPSAVPPPAAAVAPPTRTAERLKELDALRQQKLISDDEYQATRKRILEGL
jgi:hypothetical protein